MPSTNTETSPLKSKDSCINRRLFIPKQSQGKAEEITETFGFLTGAAGVKVIRETIPELGRVSVLEEGGESELIYLTTQPGLPGWVWI